MKISNKLAACAAVAAAVCMSATAQASEKADSKMVSEGDADVRIGENARGVCFSTDIHRWDTVEGRDGVVLVDRGANDWYRLEVTKGCSEKLVKKANYLLFESKPGSSCLTVGDRLTVVTYGGMQYNCRINKINKWNKDAAASESEGE